MDNEKIGALIKSRRISLGLTQKQLAEKLMLSDKTISKWERGGGTPDISLLTALASALGIAAEDLLRGEADALPEQNGVNMKKTNFYFCPHCGNVFTSSAASTVNCCGETLEPMNMIKAEAADKLNAERIENDYYITSSHEMSKEHFIDFVALLTSDTMVQKRAYPEWDLQLRFPCVGHGLLVWHCVRHGLFYQLI